MGLGPRRGPRCRSLTTRVPTHDDMTLHYIERGGGSGGSRGSGGASALARAAAGAGGNADWRCRGARAGVVRGWWGWWGGGALACVYVCCTCVVCGVRSLISSWSLSAVPALPGPLETYSTMLGLLFHLLHSRAAARGNMSVCVLRDPSSPVAVFLSRTHANAFSDCTTAN